MNRSSGDNVVRSAKESGVWTGKKESTDRAKKESKLETITPSGKVLAVSFPVEWNDKDFFLLVEPLFHEYTGLSYWPYKDALVVTEFTTEKTKALLSQFIDEQDTAALHSLFYQTAPSLMTELLCEFSRAGDVRVVRGMMPFVQHSMLNSPNGRGYTPVQCACEGGSSDVLLAILNSGRFDFASINKVYPVDNTPKLGDSPLHLASAFGNADCVALLLYSGADDKKKNSMGAIPRQVARDAETLDVYRLFEARKMDGLAAERAIIRELKQDTALDTAVLFTVTFPNLDKGTFRTSSATPLGIFLEPHCQRREIDLSLHEVRDENNNLLSLDYRLCDLGTDQRNLSLVKPSSSTLAKFDFSKIKRKITNQINLTDLEMSPRNSPRGSDDTIRKERRDTTSGSGKKEKEKRGTGSPRKELDPSPRARGSEGTGSPTDLASSSPGLTLSPRQREIWTLSPRGSDVHVSPRALARMSENESPRGPKIGKPLVSSLSSPNLVASKPEDEKPLGSVSKTQPLYRKPSNNNFRVNLMSSHDGVDGSPEAMARSPRSDGNGFIQTTPRSPRLEMSSTRLRFVSEGAPTVNEGLSINLKTVGTDEPKNSPTSESNTPPHTPKALPMTPKDRLTNSGNNLSPDEKDVLAPENIKVLSPRAVRILKPEGGARARFSSDGHYDSDEHQTSSTTNRLVRSPRSPRRVNEAESIRTAVRMRETLTSRGEEETDKETDEPQDDS